MVARTLWGLFGVLCFVVLLQSYVFFSIGSEITAYATQGQVSVTIDFVDSRPPIVTILLPPDGSTFSKDDSITIQVRALDDDAVQSVIANFTLPDNSVFELSLSDSDNNGVFEGTFTQTVQGGTYAMRAFATDVNGFRDSNQSIQFTVTAPVPTPTPSAGAGGGGGSTSRSTGPKMATVTPTKELPSPSKNIKRRTFLAKKAQEDITEKSFSEIPAKVFTLIKSLPTLVAENFSVVTGVLSLTIINALIALYLIAFSTVMLVKNLIKTSKQRKN